MSNDEQINYDIINIFLHASLPKLIFKTMVKTMVMTSIRNGYRQADLGYRPKMLISFPNYNYLEQPKWQQTISHTKHGATQLSPPLTRAVTLALSLRFQITCQHPNFKYELQTICGNVVVLSLVCMHVDGLIRHDLQQKQAWDWYLPIT